MDIPLSELLIVVASICALLTILVYSRGKFSSNKLDRKVKNKYEEIIAIQEDEIKNLKRKARTEKARQEKESIGITNYDEGNPMGMISELIAGLTPILPKEAKLIIPSLLPKVEEAIKKNPELVQNVLSKFRKGSSSKNEEKNESTGSFDEYRNSLSV